MVGHIVYTSKSGHTKRYAEMLSEALGIKLVTLDEAMKTLERNSEIIYMGWLFASSVKGYKRASKKFRVNTVVATGLCPTGELLTEVRKTSSVPKSTALFTVQGGMDREKLRGVDKFMINALIKFLEKNKTPSEKDLAMLSLIKNGGDFVSFKNLDAVIKRFKEN
ncbi:MAG: hypothetical protein IKV53_02330 [Clostridia bacterium]|nr:hypothetical protein [Clostridia bacterium]